jgi:radical SAM family uncharacterized protein/radical SAM-linked protein
VSLSDVLDAEVLPRVEKPSRYLGTEVNSVRKDPATVDVRLAFVFPDLYDLGLGNLGLHILYAVVNALPWAWAERAYAPAPDLERELRARNLPLFALESRTPLSELDGIGITLQSELTYTNILNIVDLSGLPLRTKDRRESDPLVFAGGPAVFNPEPLAPFVDFFVIGDGEDAVVEICEVLRRLKGQPRAMKLLALSMLEGVYVPALYPFETLPTGQILPKEDGPKIRKRITRDLNGATYPSNVVVPFTQQVHDRASLEVLRGCTQGCRFCQAGMVTRPVRERSVTKLSELMKRVIDNTGYEEVSLVSLSTCDYSTVKEMVGTMVDLAREERASISLPSLRLDSFSVDLAGMVAETRKSGITFAPEAASPRLRAVINKFIPDEELMTMSAGAYQMGFDVIKLYFMIGLPTERDEDIEAIASLAIRCWKQGRGLNGRARVNLGVSTFVPKPFTPFQWAAQIDLQETNRRQDLLQDALGRGHAVKFGRHHPEETFLEGLITRGDRRAGDLLEAAFRKGCRFDAWGEHLRFDLWMEAVEEVGYDVADALREREPSERLPWDHLDALVTKEWLQEDWERAKILMHAPDCRAKKCHKCGVIDTERELCATMLRDHVKARAKGEPPPRPPPVPREEPAPAQRLIFRYSRTGPARFLSHLESMTAWTRAFRRARLPLAYTQGFNKHPRLAFTTALPSGEETVGDDLEVWLRERVDPATALASVRAVLPEGFGLSAVTDAPIHGPSLMSQAIGARYSIGLPHEDRERVAERVAELLGADRIAVDRKTKTGMRRGKRAVAEIDVRPMIQDLVVLDGDVPMVEVTFVDVDGKPGKPRDLLPLLTDAPELCRVLKRDTLYKPVAPVAPAVQAEATV